MTVEQLDIFFTSILLKCNYPRDQCDSIKVKIIFNIAKYFEIRCHFREQTLTHILGLARKKCKVHERSLAYYCKIQEPTFTITETNTVVLVKYKTSKGHHYSHDKEPYIRCNFNHQVQDRYLAFGSIFSKCHHTNHWETFCHSITPSCGMSDSEDTVKMQNLYDRPS